MTSKVHIVLADRGWVLEKIGRELADRLAYMTVGDDPSPRAEFNYYINYSAFKRPGPTRDMAFFTHVEEEAPEAAARFFEVAGSVEQRVCMSHIYAHKLKDRGMDSVHVIRPGVDLDEFAPKLKIGLVGRTYNTGRKGEALVAELADVPFIEWHATGTGWPVDSRIHAADEMADFYRSIDYLLVPARYEGGPMPALEAMACGKQVISPDVGFMPEVPHIAYRNSDVEDLLRVLDELHQDRLEVRRGVEASTWDAFAEKHDALFHELIPDLRSFIPSKKTVEQAVDVPLDASRVETGKLNILLLDRKHAFKGGPAYRVPRTAEALKALGHHVEVSGELKPEVNGFDVVHVFNIWPPEAAAAQLDFLRSRNAAVVFSPIYMDLFEHFVARDLVVNSYSEGFSERLRDRSMGRLTETLKTRVRALKQADRHPLAGYPEALRHCVSMSDALIALGDREVEGLRDMVSRLPPVYKVYNAPVANDIRSGRLPDGLVRGGYVLCAGRIEPRKNQLLLIEAMRDTGIPLVFAGAEPDENYSETCRRRAEGQPVTFLEHQSHEDGSYQTLMEGAAAFVLPSWIEGAPIAALEAGMLGTRLVLSDRGCVGEYFGDHARYCDPGDIDDLKEQVTTAWADYQERPMPDDALAEYVKQSFTWERVAKETEAAYRDCLAKKMRGELAVKRHAEPVHADQPPYPVPCVDPAPWRWTQRARELWPGFRRGDLAPEELLELARIWMAMRQPGAALELLEMYGDRMGELKGTLEAEVSCFHIDESALELKESFDEAVECLKGVNCQMSLNERYHMLSCLEKPAEPQVVVELGSFHGGSTTLIADFLRRTGSGATFASLDITKPDAYWEALEKNDCKDRVLHVQHKSAEAGQQLLVQGAQHSVDILLIDADHKFAAVHEDIEAWIPLLKPGGIVIFHDYPGRCDPDIMARYSYTLGVGHAVDEYFDSKQNFKRLYFPLLKPDPNWPGYPSLFSSIAAFRSTGVSEEDGLKRKNRFLMALTRLQGALGNLEGYRAAMSSIRTDDPALVKHIEEALAYAEVKVKENRDDVDGGDEPANPSNLPMTAAKVPSALSAISVKWTASLFAYNGYAWLSRQSIPKLVDKGVAMQVFSYGEDGLFMQHLRQDPHGLWFWNKCLENVVRPDVHVCVHPPMLWTGEDIYAAFRRMNADFKAHVGLTMFETDRIPEGWAKSMNQMDEIWVPSRFNEQSFAKHGVRPDKLKVIPFGIDSSLYGPGNAEPMPIEDKRGFNFLSVFQWYKRKGWDLLLRAYLESFTRYDDVCLMLRCYPGKNANLPIAVQIENYIRELGYVVEEAPQIKLLTEFVEEEMMPGLYGAADAFVLPTRGEGWGIPYMEAMASGLPVIGTRWSGQVDFMNDENSYLIDVERMVSVDMEQTEANPFYTPDHLWAEPSLQKTKELMRHVYEDRDDARKKGAQARRDIAEQWTLERTADAMIGRYLDLMERKQKKKAATTVVPVAHEDGIYPSVLWSAPLYDPSGYAVEARSLYPSLKYRKLRMKAQPLGGSRSVPLERDEARELDDLTRRKVVSEYVHLQYSDPMEYRTDAAAAASVGRTVFPTDRIPEEWVARCNEMDEIWVPSHFNLETFSRSGVEERKLRVIPTSVDTERFSNRATPLNLPNPKGFNFLTVFDMNCRKGWELLVRAYVEEFNAREEVCLYLKTGYGSSAAAGQEDHRLITYILEILGRDPDRIPDVVLVNETLSNRQMPSLYCAADAFVLPSRGEAFGRSLMEAMACSLPVIGTGWSGNTEFMTDTNSYLIDYELAEVDEDAVDEDGRLAGHRWAEPSVDHLKLLLRKVYERRAEARDIGAAGREHIEARFSTDLISRRIEERIARLSSAEKTQRD